MGLKRRGEKVLVERGGVAGVVVVVVAEEVGKWLEVDDVVKSLADSLDKISFRRICSSRSARY